MYFLQLKRISIKISLKFVPRGPINNIPALVQILNGLAPFRRLAIIWIKDVFYIHFLWLPKLQFNDNNMGSNYAVNPVQAATNTENASQSGGQFGWTEWYTNFNVQLHLQFASKGEKQVPVS